MSAWRKVVLRLGVEESMKNANVSRYCRGSGTWLWKLRRKRQLSALSGLFNALFTGAVDFRREPWWFCKCPCMVPVLAAAYGNTFSQCLHIVRLLSVTLLPFMISTGNPKCCRANGLTVAGCIFYAFTHRHHYGSVRHDTPIPYTLKNHTLQTGHQQA